MLTLNFSDYFVYFLKNIQPENHRGKKTEEDKTRSIDHMVGYGEGYKVSEYYIIEDQDALDATDHSPVYVDIELF